MTVRSVTRSKLLLVFCGISLIFVSLQLYTFFFNIFSQRRGPHPPWQQIDRELTDLELEQLSKQSYVNVRTFLAFCTHHHIPVFLVDLHILSAVMSNKTVKDESCRYLCVKRSYTSFAVMIEKWEKKPEIISSLQKAGFQLFVFTARGGVGVWNDAEHGGAEHVTTHYLLQREGHSVHLLVFYHRLPADYWWHGPLTGSHLVQGNLQQLQVKLAYIPFSPHQGAYDRMELVKVEMDGLHLYAPKYPTSFLKQIPSSHFIPCNYTRAQLFHYKHNKDKSVDSISFRKRARKLLANAKKILDELEIPFWISSGTCLGWFRQCDIIPYSMDVDLGIWIKHYDVRLVPAMQMSGLPLKHLFGKISDSYELSFQGDGVKLDIFFFYEETDFMWNGGTQAKTGKKLKYIFPKFTLCWTEFLQMKLRVPCDTLSYIQANYGRNWFEPVTRWDWKSSPSNVRNNGVWPEEEWNKVIQTFNTE